MTNVKGKFIYRNSINKVTNELTERGKARMNTKCQVTLFGVNSPMHILYSDLTMTITSLVESYVKEGKSLIVETKNSVYTFEEVEV